jgi:hypothetical protein
VSSALSGVFLKYPSSILDEINTQIINFDIYYDTLQIETQNHLVFDKIEFDFIGNLIEYCKKENCIELVKDIYLEVNKEVQNKFWDHYANKQYFKTKREDIRETFNQLYRDIQLQQILK